MIHHGLDHERYRPAPSRARTVPPLPRAALAAQEPRPAVRGIRSPPARTARAAARAHRRRRHRPRPRGRRGARQRRRRGARLSSTAAPPRSSSRRSTRGSGSRRSRRWPAAAPSPVRSQPRCPRSAATPHASSTRRPGGDRRGRRRGARRPGTLARARARPGGRVHLGALGARPTRAVYRELLGEHSRGRVRDLRAALARSTADPALVEAMNAAIVHRGPDHGAVAAYGRLRARLPPALDHRPRDRRPARRERAGERRGGLQRRDLQLPRAPAGARRRRATGSAAAATRR